MGKISLNIKILTIVLSFTLISQGVYLYLNLSSFSLSYYSCVEDDLKTIGLSLEENLSNITGKGIALKNLNGLGPLFQGVLKDVKELAWIGIIDDNGGNWIYFSNRKGFFTGPAIPTELNKQIYKSKPPALSFPLMAGGHETIGRLVLGINHELIKQKLFKSALDNGTIILLSVLAIIDFIFFILARNIVLPMKKSTLEISTGKDPGAPITMTGINFVDQVLDDFNTYRRRFSSFIEEANEIPKKSVQRGNAPYKSQTAQPYVTSPVLIRPAVFLFVFGEALTISFLPLFAKNLYRPIFHLSENVILGLPISSFMLAAALTLPLGGIWSDMIGRKKSFLLGALLSAAGLIMAGESHDIVWLIIHRFITGMGFGIVFMTAQGYVVAMTNDDNRAEGMAIFLSAFYGGTLCGAAMGGILADRLGFRIIFIMGGVFAMLSIVFLFFFVPEPAESIINTKTTMETKSIFKIFAEALPSPAKWKALFSDREFLALTLFESIPNKICLIGLVYYLAPLILKDLGNSQSDSGRYIMCYSLVMIVFSQVISKWSDRASHPERIVFWGGISAGLSLVIFFFKADTFFLAMGISFLGFSHAFSVPNQIKLAARLKAVQQAGLGQGLGVYRQAERIGNVIAPLLCGTLVSVVGFDKTLGIIGVFMIISSMFFKLLFSKTSQ